MGQRPTGSGATAVQEEEEEPVFNSPPLLLLLLVLLTLLDPLNCAREACAAFTAFTATDEDEAAVVGVAEAKSSPPQHKYNPILSPVFSTYAKAKRYICNMQL